MSLVYVGSLSIIYYCSMKKKINNNLMERCRKDVSDIHRRELGDCLGDSGLVQEFHVIRHLRDEER